MIRPSTTSPATAAATSAAPALSLTAILGARWYGAPECCQAARMVDAQGMAPAAVAGWFRTSQAHADTMIAAGRELVTFRYFAR